MSDIKGTMQEVGKSTKKAAKSKGAKDLTELLGAKAADTNEQLNRKRGMNTIVSNGDLGGQSGKLGG